MQPIDDALSLCPVFTLFIGWCRIIRKCHRAWSLVCDCSTIVPAVHPVILLTDQERVNIVPYRFRTTAMRCPMHIADSLIKTDRSLFEMKSKLVATIRRFHSVAITPTFSPELYIVRAMVFPCTL
jgi:hypothetical protein